MPEFKHQTRTPETYLGYGRMAGLASPEQVKRDTMTTFSVPERFGITDIFAFGGEWIVTEEYGQSGERAVLELDYDAKEVNLVMEADVAALVTIRLDGEPVENGGDVIQSTVTVQEPRLYRLIETENPGKHRLRLEFDPGVKVFAFTFG